MRRALPALVAAVAGRVLAGIALANNPPATPSLNEPQPGRVVNPGDLHMESTPFSDPDAGDTHVCSDWEIWTITPAERIWVTSCIGGVERVHTHLGDGAFMGSHAGRTELLPNTQYRVRVRHRDSSGDPATEWSGWGEQLFSTGPASQVFPLEAEDIADTPAPAWVDSTGLAIVLPAGATPPSLRLESAASGLLLALQGLDGSSNRVVNPGPLAGHVAVRIHVSAGSSATPLTLPDSTLTITTQDGTQHVLYLPSMNVAPGSGNDAYFWVASSGSTFVGAAGQTTPDFSTLARGTPVPWAVRQPGYRVEVMAGGFQLPVNIAFVPSPGPNPSSPIYYVTELYGTIKVVTRDGAVRDYATNLLNFNPTGNFPGSGEQGVTGVAVDANGDVYANMLYSSQNGVENVPHYPKVVRFTSTDGGLTAATQTIVLNMTGETQGQSHQISNLTFGPDDKLYVHMGDGFDTSTGQNLNSYRGKILRLNRNGSPVGDNPFYNFADGINSRDYVYAYGLRNPFGGAWRDQDQSHYEIENGPSIDRFVKVVRARNYLYDGSDASMQNYAIYNWNPSVGPVNGAFIQGSAFNCSGFPAEKKGHLFISESGPTWGTGPQSLGKRISEFVLDADGNRISGPTPLIEYIGSGKATVVALAAGPDGLYFSDLYKDTGYASPIDRGANILRVRFVGAADFTADATSGQAPLAVHFTDASTAPNPTAWEWDFGDGATSTEQNPAHVYQDEGFYNVRLSVTGSAGVQVQQKNSYIRVGTIPRIALVGVSVPPQPADTAIADHLADLGYTVDVYDDEPANRPSAAQIAAGHELVLVSSTITSSNVGGEFRTVNLPMVFWENALLRSGRESLTDNGNVVSATQISVLDNTHPIMQGLPTGTLTVYSPAANMSVGTGNVGAGTLVLARRNGSGDVAIAAAEAGATVAAGYVTPARRVFLFLEDSSWQSATPQARAILDRAAAWAMNLSAPAITQQPVGQQVCEGGPLTLSAQAQGSSPLSYRWRRNGQVIPGATHRVFTIAAATPADAGAYDVVVTNTVASATSDSAQVGVGACCIADFNHSGGTPDDADVAAFFDAWNSGDPSADVNASGATPDDADIAFFFTRWNEGC